MQRYFYPLQQYGVQLFFHGILTLIRRGGGGIAPQYFNNYSEPKNDQFGPWKALGVPFFTKGPLESALQGPLESALQGPFMGPFWCP